MSNLIKFKLMLNKKKSLSKVKKSRHNSFSEFDREMYLKPSKIKKYMCPDCGRTKAKFETREEAERFLLYNGADIVDEEGCRPIRAYYCDSCNAWHVTHHVFPKRVSSFERFLMTNHHSLSAKDQLLFKREEEIRITEIIRDIRKMMEVISNQIYDYAIDCVEQINDLQEYINKTLIIFNLDLVPEKQKLQRDLSELKHLNFDYLRCVN